MALKTVHVQVFGRVQGVFFRDYTRRKAEELGVDGWVRNCSDGSVETLLSGSETAVDHMVDWLQDGSPASRVQRLVTQGREQDPGLDGFRIVY
jgi:acylphosphatase